MGFITTAATQNIIAKLTPTGRKKLIKGSKITSFSLGDSDANYYAANPLISGQIPSNSGEFGSVVIPTISSSPFTKLRSQLYLDSSGVFTKAVEAKSNELFSTIVSVGYTTHSANTLSQNIIYKGYKDTDSLVNLFYSFGLPITPFELSNFTATTFNNGGFVDSALSGLSTSKILVLGMDSTVLGEAIDGKCINVKVSTLFGPYNLYSTFENTGKPLKNQDITYSEDSPSSAVIGNNIAFLFSDQIKNPNNDSTLSWATGFNSFKPFSLSNKHLFNMVSDASTSTVKDEVVGIAFLDKGIIVITHPLIVENFYPISHSGATVVNLNSVSTNITQNITCLAGRGEFGTSNNSTIGLMDTPRISEIALYDEDGDMIALGKSDRHIVKGINEFVAFSINIIL